MTEKHNESNDRGGIKNNRRPVWLITGNVVRRNRRQRRRGFFFVSDWINLITAVQTCYCRPPPARRLHFRDQTIRGWKCASEPQREHLSSVPPARGRRFILSRTVGEPTRPSLAGNAVVQRRTVAPASTCWARRLVVSLTTCYTHTHTLHRAHFQEGRPAHKVMQSVHHSIQQAGRIKRGAHYDQQLFGGPSTVASLLPLHLVKPQQDSSSRLLPSGEVVSTLRPQSTRQKNVHILSPWAVTGVAAAAVSIQRLDSPSVCCSNSVWEPRMWSASWKVIAQPRYQGVEVLLPVLDKLLNFSASFAKKFYARGLKTKADRLTFIPVRLKPRLLVLWYCCSQQLIRLIED